MINLLNPAPPEDIRQAAEKLKFRDLISEPDAIDNQETFLSVKADNP